ncbi:3-isopropylmalate dehydratase large subunit [Ramlibacter tataouinensis]|uniref:3-isopropylmalate dehydratase large subunit n=1 Tax=Ramlibacter tataouinensis (strain ATCC BAA-407 / DSM 14655 / LMG 21543 / TTB310) TaxID=365046 RepID=F5Y4Y4_RAMTT|nr:3-isopropylmalate dehydratase large subunit [Ramlibacter tataouinensis]AEG92640.1 Alpha-IPM isomerase [Ramlibacter tataouinensis TTB310]
MAATLYDKIWNAHAVAAGPGGRTLLYIDRHLAHDGSFHAFEALRNAGRSVRRPEATFATPDHYIPTRDRQAIADPQLREKIETLAANAARTGITFFGPDDPRQGIVHVVGPEQGITQPGITLVCGDSHTSTHGAFGALAFGIGASEVAHVLATQALWQTRSRTLRVEARGLLRPGVHSKDLVLALIARIGAFGGTGYTIEYAGSAIRALSMEARMTVCNMSIEAGARSGLVAPDDTTFEYLAGRPYAPTGADWDRAVARWRRLPSDPDAVFEREVALDAASIEPMATWGSSPEHGVAIGGVVPDPAQQPDPTRRGSMEKALRYMDLQPGQKLEGLPVDQVFIGSCTNSRLEDLRIAASVVRGRRAVVPALVVPGSGLVKRAAEAEGLDRVFREAGFDWREPGCSMCVGMNGDLVGAGRRCASTSNRNFEGRQGKGARTHLMSPAMAAAAAVTGRMTDVRKLLAG